MAVGWVEEQVAEWRIPGGPMSVAAEGAASRWAGVRAPVESGSRKPIGRPRVQPLTMPSDPSTSASVPTRSVRADEPGPVLVVGAGVTGLRVAGLLHRSGHPVRVMEARARVGGRLLSRAVGDGGPRLDLGATWFWPNEPRVQRLVRELGVATHRQHRSGSALYDDPGGVQRLPGNPLDVESGRFSAGAETLAREMAARLPDGVVHLESPVTEIRVDDDGVVVRSPAGDVPGAHVVVAVPPALAVHRIRFMPALPGELLRLMAATPVWMSSTTKVVIRYAEPFWRKAGLAGAAVSHLGPLREIHDMSGPEGEPAALFGFASAARQPTGRIDAGEVLVQLARLFGPAAGRPEGLEIMDWRREEWTSPPGAEDGQDFQLYGHPVFSKPVGGRLHFASTETAPAFAGHIEGALLAADQVVERILAGAGVG